MFSRYAFLFLHIIIYIPIMDYMQIFKRAHSYPEHKTLV